MKKLALAAIAALMVVFGLMSDAFAQSKTVSVYGSTPAGAAAAMMNIAKMSAGAAAYGTNATAYVGMSKYTAPTYVSKQVSAQAYADTGGVVTNVTSKVGTASSGANGTGVGAWSSAGTLKSSDGTSRWLNSGSSATNGGAWAAVEGSWGSAISVTSGQNAESRASYSTSPVTYGGGKG